ncbi:MAG: hypothetical protein GX675_04935 [Erysipelotrichaceae bacterium]|nr:hypothetical protein [Erysipelotrichaceae bacterium]
MMLKISEYTIINLNNINIINLNSNYIYINGDTLKVSDTEMKLILDHIEIKTPLEKAVIVNDRSEGDTEPRKTRSAKEKIHTNESEKV